MTPARLGMAVLACVIAGACAPSSTAHPGNPSVYERIAASTDCGHLREEFDTAEASGQRDRDAGRLDQARMSTSYMEASHQRMREIGC